MQIDWFTFIAQIINFLILVWLLKCFLYRPIIRAMEQREQKISDRLQDAAEKIQTAQQEAEIYRQKQQELEEEREALFSQAKAEVESQRKVLLQKAREEVDATQIKWEEALRREQSSFLRELKARATQQISATLRRTLADLANTNLEQQLIEVFIDRLQNLDTDQREKIAVSTQANSHPGQILVHSAFEIPEASCQRITEVVREQFGNNINLKFETVSDLICGIELTTPGSKVSWSIENYLTTLEASLSSVLEEKTRKKDEPRLQRSTSGYN